MQPRELGIQVCWERKSPISFYGKNPAAKPMGLLISRDASHGLTQARTFKIRYLLKLFVPDEVSSLEVKSKNVFVPYESMFKDKTILITGAASGLGRAWAQGFSADGATVIAADINGEGLVEVPAALRITLDVSRADDVERMIATTVKQTGRIDILFNNAGLGFNKRLENSELGDFEQHIAVHLFAMVNAMRAAIPHMRRQNFGRIINTISRNAEYDTVGTSAYAAAKAGMWAASRVAAAELSDTNILINMLIPGPTRTAIWVRIWLTSKSPRQLMRPLKCWRLLPKAGHLVRFFGTRLNIRCFRKEIESGLHLAL